MPSKGTGKIEFVESAVRAYAPASPPRFAFAMATRVFQIKNLALRRTCGERGEREERMRERGAHTHTDERKRGRSM